VKSLSGCDVTDGAAAAAWIEVMDCIDSSVRYPAAIAVIYPLEKIYRKSPKTTGKATDF